MEDDPDHFVIYGNALPSLEEEEASAKKMKPIYVEDQVSNKILTLDIFLVLNHWFSVLSLFKTQLFLKVIMYVIC